MTTQPDSSSPSSSSSSPYDVFLSFRGEDTRTNFTDHLHNALVRKGIHTFIDDDELPRGEEIAPALLKAIEDSRISLIVFSENYASSRWCLDELVEILRCKESKQQIVLPIFYKVDPSHVRNQTSKFGDAFEGLIESKFKDNEEKVLIWREALTKAANLSGHPFKDGYEATFINNIVDGILSQVLSRTSLNVPKYTVGIQSRVQDVERLLDVGGNGRRMVGIWGTSGIGKTTIAKAIFNAVAYKFEGSCFLPNVREGSLIQLQETLLQEILGGKKLKIASADKGISIIHKLLRHKKILLFLDDVNQLEQLDKLTGVGWFGEGSRVIITTQDSGLLKCRGIDLIYEVQKLFDYQALELFSLNAFGINEPPNDYLELAQRAIAFADGLPLALTILGSHLRNRDKTFWQVILDGFKGEPYAHIERILQKSYDALDDYAKEAFLDIACFFKGDKKNYVLQIVPQNCIEVLLDKAMITIEWDDRILMHDLLANLGKDIVRKESPNDPGQRSRLWFYEDVRQVLMESTGTRHIKGIMVKLPEPDEIILNPECFRNMGNLQIFINHNASLCADINYLPNSLRLIDWPSCLLQSLPLNFQGNHLVEFNMPRSHIRQLDGFNFKHLPNLTCMNLRGCQFLEKIPNLSRIPNIKYLYLSNCTSLVEVDDSVGFLDRLVGLDLDGCIKLTRFGTRLRLKSLKTLYLCDCKRLESFPEIEVEMESLQILNMQGSGIRELPPSIAYLTGLRKLNLGGCFNLTRFGTTLRLKSLEELVLRDCKRLESFPEIEVEMESLWSLDISGSGVGELPSSIAYLTGLRELNLSGCFNLTRFGTTLGLKSLERLNLCDCKRLESFPEIEVEVESLQILDMRGSGIRELLPSFAYLTGLRKLNLGGCFNLTRFGATFRLKSLEELVLRDCKRLESFPEIEVEMESLWSLDISGSGVRELPSSIAYLTGLRELNLSGCFNLTRFGTTLRLKSLERLNLCDCKRLESFPEIEVEMESLQILDMRGSGIRELLPSFAYLTGLRKLNLGGCFNLTRFGATLRLKSLEELVLRDCKRLESFPEIEVEMESLWSLDMSGSGVGELPSSIAYHSGLRELNLAGCFNLTRFAAAFRLKSLERLDLRDCKRLESFPELQLLSTNSNISFPLPSNPLYCWSTLRELNLSGNNFVTLPECISKFVSLFVLCLRDCKSLLESPQEALPPRIGRVFLDNCTSLEKIPKLPLSSEVEFKHLSLINCVRLRGYDITENIFLDQVSSPHSEFEITLPGDEVPKWFSCCKDVTLVEHSSKIRCYARCEVCFEIPPNLDWETLRLVLCVFNKGRGNSYSTMQSCRAESRVHINRKMVQSIFMEAQDTHVALKCIPLHVGEKLTWLQQGNMCQIIFEFYDVPTPVKILCGVHLLVHQVADVTVDRWQRQWLLPDAMAVDDDIRDGQHQDNELLSLPSASETSLGKRPRLPDFIRSSCHRRRHW